MADESVATPSPAPVRTDPPAPRPVRAADRFFSLDVLRGFALLGILVPNIFFFAMPQAASTDPAIMGDVAIMADPSAPDLDAFNRVGYQITSVVFLGKFMFIFSLLFGAGVWFFDRKHDRDGVPTKLTTGAGLWYTRMGWLLGIGLVHALGFWYGDVLVWYAAVGLLALWWIRRWSPKTLLIAGGVSYLVGWAFMILISGAAVAGVEFGELPVAEVMGDIEQELAVYREGSYASMVMQRAVALLFMYLILLPFCFLWIIGGMMASGLALVKLGVLTGERSTAFYAKLGAIGIGLGLPISAAAFFGVWAIPTQLPGFIWQALAQGVGILQGLGYVGVVVLLAKTPAARIVTVPLAAVGRMALSNYLLHTLLCTTFFYSYGLGRFGEVQFPALWGVVAGVWCVNVVFSLIWLRFFRFGPAEWAWRSLTYFKLQPIVRRP